MVEIRGQWYHVGVQLQITVFLAAFMEPVTTLISTNLVYLETIIFVFEVSLSLSCSDNCKDSCGCSPLMDTLRSGKIQLRRAVQSALAMTLGPNHNNVRVRIMLYVRMSVRCDALQST